MLRTYGNNTFMAGFNLKKTKYRMIFKTPWEMVSERK